MTDKTPLHQYLHELAARTSTPGGGTAVAFTAAQGAALLGMACAFSKGDVRVFEAVANRVRHALETFEQLGIEDIAAFNDVMIWYRRDRQSEQYQGALRAAIGVPLRTMQTAAALADDAEFLETEGNKNLITDVAIGADLLATSIRTATFNILINYRELQDPDFKTDTEQRCAECRKAADRLRAIADRIHQDLVDST